MTHLHEVICGSGFEMIPFNIVFDIPFNLSGMLRNGERKVIPDNYTFRLI